MATTSPNNLWSPDPTAPYNLTQDMAQMQNTVQTALNTKQNTLEEVSPVEVAFSAAGGSGTVRYTKSGRVVNVSLSGSFTIPNQNPVGTGITLPVALRPLGVAFRSGAAQFGAGMGLLNVTPQGEVSFRTTAPGGPSTFGGNLTYIV